MSYWAGTYLKEAMVNSPSNAGLIVDIVSNKYIFDYIKFVL